jgi:DnaK suppressor protein
MVRKKPSETQKKGPAAKRVLKPKTPKKASQKSSSKVSSKPRTSLKTAKLSGKTTKTGKVAPKKKEIKKGPPVTGAKSTKVATPLPEKRTEKKLSPREKRFQEIKKHLVMQRNELLTGAEEALNELPGQTIFPDMGDQASAEIDRSFMLRLRGREQRLLKKIEAAIEKIDTGVFGTCDVCGEEIEIKRLQARPVTTMCIFCKTEQEEEEKLRGT